MANRALDLRAPARILGGAAISLIAEFILVGIPGPCAFPGVLDKFLHDWLPFEFWFGYVWIVGSLLLIVLSLVWLFAAAVVRWLERPHPPARD
jgi:hypothetical protein